MLQTNILTTIQYLAPGGAPPARNLEEHPGLNDTHHLILPCVLLICHAALRVSAVDARPCRCPCLPCARSSHQFNNSTVAWEVMISTNVFLPALHSEGLPSRALCPDTLWRSVLQSLALIHKDLFVPRVDRPVKWVSQWGSPSFPRSHAHLTQGLGDPCPWWTASQGPDRFLKSLHLPLPSPQAPGVLVSEAQFGA